MEGGVKGKRGDREAISCSPEKNVSQELRRNLHASPRSIVSREDGEAVGIRLGIDK